MLGHLRTQLAPVLLRGDVNTLEEFAHTRGGWLPHLIGVLVKELAASILGLREALEALAALLGNGH